MTRSSHPAGRRPLRVLAAPAISGKDGNPYIDLLYGAVRSAGVLVRPYSRARLLQRPDVVHVHWPEFLLRGDLSGLAAALDAVKVLILFTLAKARGASIVLTVHNLPDDRQGPVVRGFVTGLTALTDQVISLGPSSIPAVRAAYPPLRRTSVAVIPHGHYRDVYQVRSDRIGARRELALPVDAHVLLCLGQIRRYKALVPLADAFLAGAGPRDVLVVVGEAVDVEEVEQLYARSRGDGRLLVRAGRVPEAQVESWHAAADVVVLPQRGSRVLNSGTALLALSLGRPIAVVDSPPMRDLRTVAGNSWVHLCDGAPSALVAAALSAHPPYGWPALEVLSWPSLGRRTAEVYEAVVSRRCLAGRRVRRAE